MRNLELLVTLWPSFPHFKRFATDGRVSAVRLNSAMVNKNSVGDELEIANSLMGCAPLYFDIKGRQLRVTESFAYKDHLELTINHPIKVKTPTMVLFKAGADYALLNEVVDGKHLIFEGGPGYLVYEGESLHIRDESLIVEGPTFLDYEIEKIEKAKKAGISKYCLSYAESKADIDQFRDYIGKEAEIIAKIENKKGLEYVAKEFRKEEGLSLMAARGDLYVEIDKPHEILNALKLIIKKDHEACAGSRMLLSVIHDPVPSCSDLSELAWMYDIGYRKMMLCDELCLKEELLARAVNVFDSFRKSYCK